MFTRFVGILSACVLVAAAAPTAAYGFGGFIKDKLKEQVKDKTGRAVNEAGDAAYEGGKNKASSGGKESAKAPDEERASPGEEPAGDEAKPARAAAGEQGNTKSDEVTAGEVFGNKFDFIPGDKVLVFDDFAETDVGDYPSRWTVKDGGGNATEVVSYKGRKWFKSTRSDDGINEASLHYLRYDPKGDMPKKFTLEFDADMGGLFSIVFNKGRGSGGREVSFGREQVRSENVTSAIKPFGPVVQRVSISVNGTYVKVYIGGTRVLQDPDGIERPLTRLGLRFDTQYGRYEQERPALLDHQMFTALRLAEGGKDVTQALNTEGRIVVHGIYFDTASDVLKPESGGALRRILQVMNDDQAVRFLVEGHTDDQGGAKVNGPLSEKRAAAVKAWLMKEGVDGKRLETKGLGATKPIDASATQEGRANNRRVEFVKLPPSA